MVRLTSNKPNPKPIIEIEKIELTEGQKQEVQNILDGKPSKQLTETWDKQGKRSKYERHYQQCGTEKDRLRKIREKYFKGAGKCTVCLKFPLYKVTHKMEGISLVEYYCESCMEKWKSRL